jgi:radical SAM-linked protein
MQRLRLKFSRGEELKFLSHLDLMRLWERALRRAGLPLAYSEGFTPHPQIALAAPLSVGVTSQAELMDISLSRWLPPQSFIAQMEKQLPQGIKMIEVWPVGPKAPSLQSQVRFIEYKVEVETKQGREEVESALQSFLSADKLPWHHFRDTGARYYDLRALVDDLWLIDCHDSLCVLGMRLRCDEKGAGRPEQVTKALGFSQHPESIHRTKLILS